MRSLLTLAFASLWLAAGCGSNPLPASDLPPKEALARFGRVTTAGPKTGSTVVLIEDRHSISRRLARESGPIVRVRESNAHAVRWLAEAGFRHLGCEYRAGPLPEDGPARQQRELFAGLATSGADLNAWNFFQPLRFEMALGRDFRVRGVEDPALYEADLTALERLQALQEVQAEATAEEQALGLAEARRLRKAIAQRVDLRGERAGAECARWLRQEGAERGILMLGAAHIDAAEKALLSRGFQTLRFRSFALDQGHHEGEVPPL